MRIRRNSVATLGSFCRFCFSAAIDITRRRAYPCATLARACGGRLGLMAAISFSKSAFVMVVLHARRAPAAVLGAAGQRFFSVSTGAVAGTAAVFADGAGGFDGGCGCVLGVGGAGVCC